jgi:integrase/recombinase XerC
MTRNDQIYITAIILTQEKDCINVSMPTWSRTVVDWVATDAGVAKHLSPHRIRHSSITTFLDASGGDVRTAQRLSRYSRFDTLMIYDDNRKGLHGKASEVLADLV